MNSKGFSPILLIVILIVVAVVGLTGWKVAYDTKQTSKPAQQTEAAVQKPDPEKINDVQDINEAQQELDSATIETDLDSSEIDKDLNSIL